MDDIRLRNDSLRNFLDSFDAVAEKYDVDEDEVYKFDLRREYDALLRYERSLIPPSSVQRDYAFTGEVVASIHKSAQKARDIVGMYFRTRDELLNRFININGLERLYSEHYFDFEYEMLTRLDPSNGGHDFYRNHFIHQIRNGYEMFVLLKDFGFLDRVYKAVKVRSGGQLMTFARNGIEQCTEYIYSNTTIKSFYMSYYKKKYCGTGAGEYNREALRELIYRKSCDYLTKLVCLLSALFHDIGYPIVHGINFNNRLSEHISLIYYSGGSEFERICSLLSGSLLFKLIDRGELRDMLCATDPKHREKHHGAISAVYFLLHFYENGAFAELEPIKRTAVELAAVAIYEHTIQYGELEKKCDRYETPHFAENPYGWLLRVCDDLQEWDRLYFDYRGTMRLEICDACKTPVVGFPKRDGQVPGKGSEPVDFEQEAHVCCCQAALQGYERSCYFPNDYPVVRPMRVLLREEMHTFHETPVIYAETCECLTIGLKENVLALTINYKPFSLLELCRISSDFSKYRAKDLDKLKKILSHQFPDTKVSLDYFMTTNPLLLKMRIIEEAMRALSPRMNLRTAILDYCRIKLFNEPASTDELKKKLDDMAVDVDLSGGQLRVFAADPGFKFTTGADPAKNFDQLAAYVNKVICETLKKPISIKALDRLLFIDTPLDQFKRCYETTTDKWRIMLKEKMIIYINMLRYYRLRRLCDQLNINMDADTHIDLRSMWEERILKKVIHYPTIDTLLADAKLQLDRLAEIDGKALENQPKWKVNGGPHKRGLFVGGDDLYNAIYEYCRPTLTPYDVKPKKGKVYLDYYSDLYFYKTLAEMLD